MTIAILDTNDCNLQLWHGNTHLRSPGYALLAGKQYRFGREARETARLQPRDINTRYWWQLSTEPLQPALGPARHTADLVHAHLLDLHRQAGEPSEVLLAVSSSMQRDQLALLLGIVQQCPFDAVGLVNRSVVLGSLYGVGEQFYHLEVQLHQSLLSRLESHAGETSFQRSVPLPGCGLLQLQERLVETIASAFIRQTRFDPRRKAATEQQLYNSLPDALRALGSGGDSNLEVSGYRARINHGELLSAGQRLFDGVPKAMEGARTEELIIDPVAALLPGLGEQFPGATILAPDALHTAAERHLQRVVQREEALSFITSLPSLERQSSPTPEPPPLQTEVPQETSERPAPPPAAPQPAPTHLLQGTCARALASRGTDLAPGCELYLDERGWLLRGAVQGLKVNGQAYSEGQALRCGDELDSGQGEPMRLIEVLPG